MKYISYSLKLFLLISVFFAAHSTFCQKAPPGIEWQKALGGSQHETARCIRQTADGGYIVAGFSHSNDGDVSGHHSTNAIPDCWVVKLNAAGNIQWQKSFGGESDDLAYAIEQTTDGGYIVAGTTSSNDGDVSGNHLEFSEDYWVVKLDANGNIQWQKCLGGSQADQATSIQQTTDGGYIVVGNSGSNDGDVTGHHESTIGGYVSDCWVVKLDANGNIEWQKSLGGSNLDAGTFIEQTADGGYIVAGYTGSNDGDLAGISNQGGDYWIVKLDTEGNIQWQKCFGGSQGDQATSIQQTTDGGYIVAGTTSSNDGDVTGHHENEFSNEDYWIVKLDVNGNMEWQKCFGGSRGELATSIQQTSDGGYVVAGSTNSNDGDVTGFHPNPTAGILEDYWIVKLTADGNIEWQKCLGGSETDIAYSIRETIDGGYIIAGSTFSPDGDVTGLHFANGSDKTMDYWIVKLIPECNATLTEVGRTMGDGGIFCPDVHTIELEYSSARPYTGWEVGNAEVAALGINDGHFYAQKGETITVKLPAPIESDHEFIFIAHSGNLKCPAKYVASDFPTNGCDGTVTPTLIRPASSPQSDDGVFGFQINTSACTDQGNVWVVLLRNTLTGAYYGNNEQERYVAVGGLPAGTYSVSFGDLGSICGYMDVTNITVPVNSSGRMGSGASGREMTARLAANPVHNTVVVSITGGKPVSVYLSDLFGRILWKKDNATGNNITIPLQNIVKGNYLVKVSDGKTSSTLKLMKE